MADPSVLLVLDLVGTFAFALNGALTAVRTTRVDIVGVLTLGLVTGVGGGIVRDVLLDSLPPATFVDWRYLAAAAAGGMVAFGFSGALGRFGRTIDVFDAAGLSLFAVTGAGKALALGAGPVQAVILGVVTGVGGGTIRDVLIGRVPSVLSSGMYAIPAAAGALLTTVAIATGVEDGIGGPAAVGAATVCFAIRVVSLHYGVDAPVPPALRPPRAGDRDGGGDLDTADGTAGDDGDAPTSPEPP